MRKNQYIVGGRIRVIKKQQLIFGGGKIPNADGIYLALSKMAYEPEDKRLETITKSGETFTYDPELSELRTAVYHSPTRLIIAHRGTVPSDPEDINADGWILADNFEKSPRAMSSLRLAKKAHQKYPNLIVSNTGHSLGGATAQYVGFKFDLDNSKVTAFNAGSSPSALRWAKSYFKHYGCKLFSRDTYCKKIRNQTLYTTQYDPIAMSQLPLSTVVDQEVSSPHSMDNYIVEGEDEEEEKDKDDNKDDGEEKDDVVNEDVKGEGKRYRKYL
jgi:hypothetical protein